MSRGARLRSACARAAPGLAHAAAAAVALLLLAALARPLSTDDLWWHLGLGERYLDEGPWLRADPMLHTATRPPPPAAWLSDAALAAVDRAFGLQGLRVLHAAVVGALLAWLWTRFRAASGSALFASFGSAAAAALAAYRLFQLRPDLASLAAAIALGMLVLRDRQRPDRVLFLGAAVLSALWANLHAAFALGPLMLAAAALGAALEIPWRADAARRRAVARTRRLAAAGLVAALAACLNPAGAAAYLPSLRAGGGTPDLGEIADEWVAFAPFALPAPNLPPSPLVFALVWLLLLALPLAGWAWLRRLRGGRAREPDLDPALLGIALLSLAAMLAAIRFVWLAVFPLWLLAAGWALAPRAARSRALLAVGTLALLPGFVWCGDWPLLSRGIGGSAGDYLDAYPTRKYHAHAVWFLDDAELRGNLYNPYFAGGFLGYWLAPELRVFVNGSLNVSAEVMRAYHAVQAGGSDPEARDPGAILDAFGVDLFLGIGLPAPPPPNRPWQYTTTHLERDARWIPIFRNANSAVYLRRGERNRENLERVARYYERAGVPFDPERGLDPERVLQAAPDWAAARALAPLDRAQLEAEAERGPPARRVAALSRLASAHALLGLYERSAALDRQLLGSAPHWNAARRRRVWSLLRLDRPDEARAELRRLRSRSPRDPALAGLEAAVSAYLAAGDRAERDALAASLLLLSREEGQRLASRYRAPELRRERGPARGSAR